MPAHNKIIDFAKVDDTNFDMSLALKKTEEQYQEEAEQLVLRVQNIPQSQRPYAEMIVPLYGDEIPCLMYAPKWKQREQGVQQFSAGMKDAVVKAMQGGIEESATLGKEQRANQALLLNMTEVLKDKVQQIVNKCLPMVERYQEILREMPQLNPRQDTSIFERFLMQLLEKLPDAKYQKQIIRVYTEFFKIAQLDCSWLCAFLFRPQSYTQRQNASSHKHLTPRLQILVHFLGQFESYKGMKRVSEETFPVTNPILPILKSCMEATTM